MAFEVANVDDAQVSVRTRDAGRWVPMYDALIANPGKWLTVPDADAKDVKKAGKQAVQSRLDAQSGPGGVVLVGTADGKTVVKYTPPTKAAAPKA